MLGLSPILAKRWEGDEGVPPALGQPQILLCRGDAWVKLCLALFCGGENCIYD